MAKMLSDPRCTQQILARLSKVGPDTPRRWGKMNAAQMICHLSDSFLGVMGEKPMEIPARYPGRKLMKWVGLYVPLRWPKGVATRPEFDAWIGGTPPSDFQTDKALLIELMGRFTERPRTFRFQIHPIFLELSEREWMVWGYRHMDHHLRQFGE